MANNKAFIRYANNKAVPGSLIVRKKAPSVGVWKEVNYDLCCGDVCPQPTPFCTENWAFENFDGTTFRNGDAIPEEQDPSVFGTLTTPAWCYYDGDPNNGQIFGKLYNWYAVNDPRGIAPVGWKVPSVEDWQSLFTCLYSNGFTALGGVLKTTGTIESNTGLWQAPNTGAMNNVGFSALPGGNCAQGGFNLINQFAHFWSSTEVDSTFARNFSLNFSDDNIDSNLSIFFKNAGYSVRLIKDI